MILKTQQKQKKMFASLLQMNCRHQTSPSFVHLLYGVWHSLAAKLIKHVTFLRRYYTLSRDDRVYRSI